MHRIAYLSNIFVRIEGFFVDSFCFWAVRPMNAIKNSKPFSLSSLYFAICPIWP